MQHINIFVNGEILLISNTISSPIRFGIKLSFPTFKFTWNSSINLLYRAISLKLSITRKKPVLSSVVGIFIGGGGSDLLKICDKQKRMCVSFILHQSG